MEPLLRVNNLTKSFGTLPVIQRVGFDIQPGEVVGLTGSIGSGKSVLVMLLAGMYMPDDGDIHYAGRKLKSPFRANSLGIGVIHQRHSLDDHLDIAGNIFLGNEIGGPAMLGELRVLNVYRMHEEAARILNQLGVEVNSLHDKVSNLSSELRQMIAIARVLTYPVRLVVIDEPTILLSYLYQQKLLSLVQGWQKQGVAVLFSSNNLDHLFAVTDRIIVLNQGRKVADQRTDEITRESVVNLLLGGSEPPRHSPLIWDFDSSDRVREYTEKLHYHQLLLGKDLAAETSLNRQLTAQLAEQVQALDQANVSLREAQHRLLSEREDERKRLARELHDQVIQDLLSINYELEAIETEHVVPPSLTDELSDVRLSIRELVDNLRRMCGDLRPPTIDSLGLGAALQSYSRDWSTRTGIRVELNLDTNLGRLPEASELSIFRIVQEGLNNVWRHAHASSVQITLEHTSPRMLMVSLRDDGLGLAEDLDLTELTSHGHYGLMGISERVAFLGGRLRLQRPPEGGSLLMVEIPHPRVDIYPVR
jgi:signal transduction histidine kinase